MIYMPASQRNFLGITALLFAGSTALTIAWCRSMSAMHAMPMPGGWTMSMMWMRMPGQSWAGTALEFLGMWLVMMVAMMLPSLLPMLWHYRRGAGGASGVRVGVFTALVGAGYFFVWTIFGALAFLVGVLLTSLEMQLPAVARAVPMAIGATVLIAGAAQFSAWKAHHLACCRAVSICCEAQAPTARGAWLHGLRMGAHCVHCCLGLTTMLLMIGVMDLRTMAVVTAAISAERLMPAGERVARLSGALLIVAGMVLVLRAALQE